MHPKSINALAAAIYEQNIAAGWYEKRREVGTRLALIHSEISEALEGDRKGLMDDHLPHRSMFEVELADAVIRILDLAGSMGLDLEGAIEEKLTYNQHRADHKRETRKLAGGKAY